MGVPDGADMRATRLLTAALALGALAGGATRAADDAPARTTWVGASTSTCSADPGEDVHAQIVLVPYVRWNEDFVGHAVPTAATLTLDVTGPGGLHETFDVGTPVPVRSGIQPIDVGGGQLVAVGAFPFDLPGSLVGADAVQLDVLSTYTVTFGPGAGTGTSVSSSQSQLTVLPPSTLGGGAPLVTILPILPDGDVPSARPGTDAHVAVAVANNHPEQTLTCRISGYLDTTAFFPLGGSDPDGAAYELFDPARTQAAADAGLRRPLVDSSEAVTIVGPGAVGIVDFLAPVPIGSAPNEPFPIAFDAALEVRGPGGQRLALDARTHTIVYSNFDRDVPATNSVTAAAVTGAFSRSELSPIRCSVPGSFLGSLFEEPEPGVDFDIESRTAEMIGFGFRGYTTGAHTETDAIDVDAAPTEFAYEITTGRGTSIIVYTHNDVELTLPGGLAQFRMPLIGAGPGNFAHWSVSLDLTRDLLEVFTPRIQEQPRKTLYKGSYSAFRDAPPAGFQVVTDTYVDFATQLAGRTGHALEVLPSSVVISGPEAPIVAVVATGVDGKPTSFVTRSPDGFAIDTTTNGPGLSAITATQPPPAAPGLATGVFRFNTLGGDADLARSSLAVAARDIPVAVEPEDLGAAQLRGRVDLSGRPTNDEVNLVLKGFGAASIFGPRKRAKLEFPESCRDVTLDIGGSVQSFTIDARGRARSEDRLTKLTIKLRTERDGSTTASLRFKQKKAALAPLLRPFGVTDETTGKEGRNVTVPLRLLLCGQLYAGTSTARYVAVAGKRGVLKPPR